MQSFEANKQGLEGHRRNTFLRARNSILLVSGTHYKMPATLNSFRRESGRLQNKSKT